MRVHSLPLPGVKRERGARHKKSADFTPSLPEVDENSIDVQVDLRTVFLTANQARCFCVIAEGFVKAETEDAQPMLVEGTTADRIAD